MNKILKITMLVFCVLFGVNNLSAQKVKTKTAAKPVAGPVIDFGQLRANT